MFIKNKVVDEKKSFYYQNVMSHLYIVMTLISAIVLGLLPNSSYWLMAISSLFPFAYEALTQTLRGSNVRWYYNLGLYLNSIIFSFFIYLVSFEPSLSGLLVLMFTYTLISYGGWRLFLMLFPTMA